MVSFIHIADLHIGLRLTRFAEKQANKIREGRIRALENVLTLAAERKADFIIVAGDLFDDPAVDSTTAWRIFRILEETADRPVFVLPGNHDPLLPGSVWEREPWCNAETGNVKVLSKRVPVEIPGAVLLPCPVLYKTSLDDPTEWIPADVAGGTKRPLRIGVAHGSIKYKATLAPDDHLIEIDAAEKHRLDYLALGHWHSFHQFEDSGGTPRTVYPGVHEPIGFTGGDDIGTGWMPYTTGGPLSEFIDDGKGKALFVQIPAPGAAPELETLEVGYYNWSSESVSLHTEDELSALIQRMARRPDADRTILKLRLEGVLDARGMQRLDELRDVLDGRYLHSELDEDSLVLKPSDEEIRSLLGSGVLRLVHEKLRQMTEQPEAGADTTDSKIAERAIKILYQLVSEVRK